MSKTVKKIIIFVIIIFLLVMAYVIFFTGKSPVTTGQSNSSLQSSSGTPVTGIIQNQPASSIEANKIGQEFVNQLINLQAIKLNDDIFSSLAFQSLEDFTIVLVQPGNEGRMNPFAPFGADGTEPGVPTDQVQPSQGDLNVTPVDDLPPTDPNSLENLNGS